MSTALLVSLVTAAAIVVAVAVVAAVAIRRRRAARVAAPARTTPRHPIVLVHGIMGLGEERYFRGIAQHLAVRGAVVREPQLPPFASVPERAARLASFIRELPDPRVNLIAHSMGGLDARWAITKLDLGDRVASLTTIGTPHRGTPLADLKDLAPAAVARRLGAQLGLASEALDWLTTARMARFNDEIPDDPRVAYASVIGRVDSAGVLDMNPLLVPSHRYVRRRAGTNDGLVPTTSQHWGDVLFEVPADHWAQIGWLSRFDTRTIYDEILSSLVARGF